MLQMVNRINLANGLYPILVIEWDDNRLVISADFADN